MKKAFESLWSWWTKENCYNNMEAEGHAALEMCGGKVGGDVSTDFLSYSCCGCKYWVLVEEMKGETIMNDIRCNNCSHKDICIKQPEYLKTYEHMATTLSYARRDGTISEDGTFSFELYCKFFSSGPLTRTKNEGVGGSSFG